MRRKSIRAALTMLLLVCVFTTNLTAAGAAQIAPRYTGIYEVASTLTVSTSGAAKCKGSVVVLSGYTVELTVELKQDGDTIKTWNSSGSGTVSAGGTYYVMSGHSYVVTTTAEVKDSSGRVIETPSENSETSFY